MMKVLVVHYWGSMSGAVYIRTACGRLVDRSLNGTVAENWESVTCDECKKAQGHISNYKFWEPNA